MILPRRRRMWLILALIPTTVVMILSGCSTFEFYRQAAAGQWEILHKRRPIPEVLAETPADSELARRLRLVEDIRDFARHRLQLPVKQFYSDYSDLQRPYVLWNLFAAPELSLKPKSWCYPLVGCLNYRGYFNLAAAQNEAAQLQQQSMETYVGGVLAYSTLGWFNDPVLNTFWRLSDADMAALLFHELTHHVVFVAGDTTFNESFATSIELYGTGLWLQQRYGTKEAEQLQLNFQRRQQVVALAQQIIAQLRQLYASSLSDTDKRAGKQRLFKELQDGYQKLRGQWGEDAGFDAWFSTPLNNAKLVTLTSYFDDVPAFLAKIQQLQGDLPAYYRWAKALGDQPKAQRDAELKALAAAAQHGSVEHASTTEAAP